MKYTFETSVNISFTPEEFKSIFRNTTPENSANAVKAYAQIIIDKFSKGELMSVNKLNQHKSSTVQRAYNEPSNNMPFRHGPGRR